jgi:hypothetical protein
LKPSKSVQKIMWNQNDIQTHTYKHTYISVYTNIILCRKFIMLLYEEQFRYCFPLNSTFSSVQIKWSTNSVPPLLTASCHVRYFAQWHCWNMYVCTYGTATWAANILCKEVFYNVALGWVWSYTNSILSLYSVWNVKWKQ